MSINDLKITTSTRCHNHTCLCTGSTAAISPQSTFFAILYETMMYQLMFNLFIKMMFLQFLKKVVFFYQNKILIGHRVQKELHIIILYQQFRF